MKTGLEVYFFFLETVYYILKDNHNKKKIKIKKNILSFFP